MLNYPDDCPSGRFPLAAGLAVICTVSPCMASFVFSAGINTSWSMPSTVPQSQSPLHDRRMFRSGEDLRLPYLPRLEIPTFPSATRGIQNLL